MSCTSSRGVGRAGRGPCDGARWRRTGPHEENAKGEPVGRANHAKPKEICCRLTRLQAVVEVADVEAGSGRLRRRRW